MTLSSPRDELKRDEVYNEIIRKKEENVEHKLNRDPSIQNRLICQRVYDIFDSLILNYYIFCILDRNEFTHFLFLIPVKLIYFFFCS